MRHRYSLPEGMRYSLLAERKEFYSKEFDVERVGKWLEKHRDPLNTVFAAIVGRHTGIFRKKYRRHIKTPILIDEFESLDEVAGTIAEFLPEGAYYDRNVYEDLSVCKKCKKSYGNCWNCRGFLGQELAFDIDPENIPCPKCGTLADKMKRKQGLGFCEYELSRAKEQAVGLKKELSRRFPDTEVVYSGRGYHLHVYGKKALEMERAERKELAKEVKGMGYPIDAWITEGESRLIRLPYSLHGMVSRVVFPIKNREMPAFNPLKSRLCRPKFL